MPTTNFDLILHPVRLRIITSISNDQVTAKEIADALPEVSQSTLYRHINTLVEGGMLQVVAEIPQRGTVERVYSLVAPPSLTPEDLQGLSKAECQQMFTVVLTTMLKEALDYLDKQPDDEEINVLESGFDLTKVQVNLSADEIRAMNQEICGILMRAADNKPAEGRKRVSVSSVFIPLE